MSVLRHSATVRGSAECRPRPLSRRRTMQRLCAGRCLACIGRGATWTLSGFSAHASRMMQRQTTRLSRDYFPRAVFFFGLGFPVLPVLPGAASFFGRFGDTCSLLPWLVVLQCLRVRIRSEAPSRPAGRSARRCIGKPSLPEHGAIASQAGDGDGEWLLQPSKAGEGRAPVRSAELEPGDRGIAAVPADDPPEEGVGLGRPGDSQLITSHPNNAEGIRTRAFRTAPGGAGSAPMPATTGCRLTAHAHIRAILATIPRPANLFASSSSGRPRQTT